MWYFSGYLLGVVFALLWVGIDVADVKLDETAKQCEEQGFFVVKNTVYNCEKARGQG